MKNISYNVFYKFFHFFAAPSNKTPKIKIENPETDTVANTAIIICDFYFRINSPLIFKFYILSSLPKISVFISSITHNKQLNGSFKFAKFYSLC